MTIKFLFSRIIRMLVAMAIAVVIIAVSAPEASANDASVYLNNQTSYEFTLKYTGPDSSHQRFDTAEPTIPPGFNGLIGHANSDWPYTVDPQMTYAIGDTGKSVGFNGSQGSPVPTNEAHCTYQEYKEGPPPTGFNCSGNADFGVNYSVYFVVTD